MLTTKLYPYQEPAVDRFIERGNLLVAWEMGLGKTLCAIAAVETLSGMQNQHSSFSGLIVCPASLIVQWAKAVAAHTDCQTYQKKIKGETFTLPVPAYAAIIDGTINQRKKQFRQAYADLPRYVIMSYGTVVSSPRWVRKLHAEMIVIDEATNIKSFSTKRSKAIKKLRPPYRLALSGTPIENRTDEVFSIMQWVDETVLGDWDLFDRTFITRDIYDNIVEHKNLKLFHNKVGSAMSRRKRTDPDVAPYLPATDIDQWRVGIDEGSRAAYNLIAQDLLDSLRQLRGGRGTNLASYYAGDGQDDTTELGRVMSRQLALELLLDHPDLIVNSALDYQETLREREKGIFRVNWKGSKYCYEIWQQGILDDALESSKLDRLVHEVHKVLAREGSKILIFSKYKYMLSIIEDALDVPCVQYHGDLSSGAKAGAVSRFSSEPGLHVFLSSHAGAYGTDMHMANWLINYDLPWSSGRADQINGRHQRAASEFDLVYIRNMITEGTVEERKLDMLSYKRSLSEAVIDGRVDVSGKIVNDLDTLSSWLEEEI